MAQEKEKLGTNGSKTTPFYDYYDAEEFKEFMQSLPSKVKFKVAISMKKIEEIGLADSMLQKLVKKVEDNLYEIRVDTSGLFIRVFFFKKDNNNLSVLHVVTSAFKKKSNKLPKKEIEKAIQRRERYNKEHRNQ